MMKLQGTKRILRCQCHIAEISWYVFFVVAVNNADTRGRPIAAGVATVTFVVMAIICIVLVICVLR